MTPDTTSLVFTILFGLAFGSFFNVCIHRIPRQLSLNRPGSRCPSCGYVLTWYDNIPVVSYAILGAKCRGCRRPISLRYPIVELVTCGIFVLHLFVFGLSPLFFVRLVFASAMIVLFAIDLEHHLLPDIITLPALAIGLGVSLFLPPGLRDAIVGSLLGGGVLWLIGEAYYRYAGQEGMGGGDVKMLAMIGAFLGWKLVLLTLVLSSLAGSLAGVAVIVGRRGDMKYALPYGTCLSLAALVASLAGDRILAWYLSFT